MVNFMKICFQAITITCSLLTSNVLTFYLISHLIHTFTKLVFKKNYLFLVGNLFKACQATASYQLFFPDDETMEENKNFYLTLPEVTKDMFQPRPEALLYYERYKAEKALIDYIEENFQFDEGDISEPNSVKESDNEIPSWLLRFSMSAKC